MLGRTHLAMGAAVGALVGQRFLGGDPIPSAVFTGICCLGSLFPDIDLPTSMMGKWFRPLSRFLHRHCGHRGRGYDGKFVNGPWQGFVHSPLNGLLLTGVLYALLELCRLPIYPAIAFGTGFLVHLVQDTFTKGGIPWFYPLRYRNYSLFRMKSGSRFEWAVSVFLFVVLAVCLYHEQLYDLIGRPGLFPMS